MKKKTKKIQCVIFAKQKETNQLVCLLLQTNERRGQFWQNVTGKVEKDESFEEGAFREVEEETQFKKSNLKKIIDLELTHSFTDQYDREVEERAFLLISKETWEPKLDPNEHQSYRWLPTSEINRSSVKFEGNYEAIKKSLSYLSSNQRM